MSMSSNATLMIGVRLSDVFRIEQVEIQQLRYNPDTGVPYQEKVTANKFYLFDKEIPEPKEPDPSEWAVQATNGLTIRHTGMDAWDNPGIGWQKYKLDQYVIGVLLAEAEPEPSINRTNPTAISMSAVANAQREAYQKFIALGYNKELHLFLIAYQSC